MSLMQKCHLGGIELQNDATIGVGIRSSGAKKKTKRSGIVKR